MKRITVSDIKPILSLAKNSELYISEPTSVKIFFVQDLIVILNKTNILSVRSLANQQVIFSQQLKNIKVDKIKKVKKINQLLAFICEQGNLMHVINMQNSKIEQYDGHLAKINDICVYEDGFATAGQDMTIRLWKTQSFDKINKGNKMLKFPIALKGHKGAVKVLALYHKFLISGSDDCSIIIWHQKSKWCQLSFNKPILKITPCFLSQQILVLTSQNIVNFIPLPTILQKKPKTISTLQIQQPLNSYTKINEIDQSFTSVLCRNSLRIVQVHLFQEMHCISMQQLTEKELNQQSKQINNQNKITDLKWKGRCMFYAIAGQGVKILKI